MVETQHIASLLFPMKKHCDIPALNQYKYSRSGLIVFVGGLTNVFNFAVAEYAQQSLVRPPTKTRQTTATGIYYMQNA